MDVKEKQKMKNGGKEEECYHLVHVQSEVRHHH